MTEEIFDIVDESDRVVGQAPRSEVHANGRLHRAVSIFVFNSAGQLLVQMRTAWKDEYPSCWTSSASGHVSAGENYDDAAPRELEEELGLGIPIERLKHFAGGPETANEFTVLYKAVTDETPVPDRNEIEYLDYMELNEIQQRITESPEEFTPPFRVMFDWYIREFASSWSEK